MYKLLCPLILVIMFTSISCGSNSASNNSNSEDILPSPSPSPTLIPIIDESIFYSDRDLISLHYDHAADRDDMHSAAADRTILQSLFGLDWLLNHTVKVSGTCGINCPTFRHNSSSYMSRIWTENTGSWILGLNLNREAISNVATIWYNIITAGGRVWVKEGGQSDFTAEVIEQLHRLGIADTKKVVKVIQHSKWNEEHTRPQALAYVKEYATYIKISDANAYLREDGGSPVFENAARSNSTFSSIWKVAFEYLNPNEKLDFSDTGELMYIVGLGEMGINSFRETFL